MFRDAILGKFFGWERQWAIPRCCHQAAVPPLTLTSTLAS